VTSPAPVRVSERIRLRLGNLSPSERKVARLLLSGPPTIGLESSAKLAQRAGVSGPTISRFVTHQLGFESYGAFQNALREEISARVVSPVETYRQYWGEQQANGLLARSGAALGEAVTATVQALDPDEFSRAVGLLGDRRHQVLAIGGWFSHLVAGYMVSLLREIRPGVRFIQPVASDRAAAVADISKRDIVAVFDFRRYERDTAAFAQAAHNAGARIVLFTDPWLSPVADIADALLPAQVASSSPFENLTPTVAVVETLVTAIAEDLGDQARERFEQFGGIADRWIRSWPGAESAASQAGVDVPTPRQPGPAADSDSPDEPAPEVSAG
jgi:DNA-binding MurR/RpiR family transcriptional regulator